MLKFTVTSVLIILAAITYCDAVEEECIDVQGNTVIHGMLFVPGPSVCSLCTCWNGEPLWCKAIYCDPPFFCKDFKLGNRCCEWECLDKPGENELFELRLKKRDEILSGTGGGSTLKTPFFKIFVAVLSVFKLTKVLP